VCLQYSFYSLLKSSPSVIYHTHTHTHTHSLTLQDPELLEVFNIRLVNASGGGVLSTTGNTVSTVTVRANDHPYGRFVFSQAFRPLEVGEGVGNVEVTVTREFGTVGMVRVEFATIASDNLLASPALVGIIDVAQLVRNR